MTYNFENGVLMLTRESDGAILVYPYNPETQEPFLNEDDAIAYANSRPMYFITPPAPLTLEDAKEQKAKEVRDYFQKQIDEMQTKYAPYELQSFTDQKEEWKLWKQDPNASVPIVSAMATARGISKEELMQKIEDNVIGIATLQGQQNKLEDAINACTTLEELEAIEV